MIYFSLGGSGGGSGSEAVVLKGSDIPASTLGKNGDVYLLYKTGTSDLLYLSNVSDTGAFIPTGTSATKNTKFIIKCNIHGGGSYATPIGNRLNVSSTNSLVFFKYNGKYTAYYGQNGSDTKLGNVSSFVDKDIIITLSNDLIKIEDEQGNNVSATPTNKANFTTQTVMLFNLGTGASSIYGSDTACFMDLYYCEVYNNDRLVRYLIPKTVDSNIGLYDIVTGSFFAVNGNITATARQEEKEYTAITEVYLKNNDEWVSPYGIIDNIS